MIKHMDVVEGLKEIQSKIDEPINYIIGGDLGIKAFITLSTGEVIANPKYLIANQTKLAKLQRKVSLFIDSSIVYLYGKQCFNSCSSSPICLSFK